MGGKSEGKLICPRCGEYGRLEIQKGSIYRINHDVMKGGKKYPYRHYLGSLPKSLTNLRNVAATRDDLIDPGLISKIERVVREDRKEHFEKIKNSEYGTLIARIIQLSSKLGFGWSSKRHYLVKQDICPHCKNRIQHRFQRIGELKDGKFNIEQHNIEVGNKEYTSIMYDDKVWWIGRWSNQELKDKMRISLEGEN